MPIRKNAASVANLSKEQRDSISITLSLSELGALIQWAISSPSISPAIATRQNPTKLKSAKLAAKKRKAGASKPAKAARSKVEDSPYHKLNEAERRAAFLKAR